MIYNLFIVLLLVSNVVFAEDLPIPFWKNEYKRCYESADLIVMGSVTDLNAQDFLDGGNGYGYTKFNLTVNAEETVKGNHTDTFQYVVWYEGKNGDIPDINGENSLFCLYYDKDGSIHDPDGFGRLPVNPELKEYMYSLRTENNDLIKLAKKYAGKSLDFGEEFDKYFTKKHNNVNEIKVSSESNIVTFIHHGVAYDGCSFEFIVTINRDDTLNNIIRNDLGCAEGP